MKTREQKIEWLNKASNEDVVEQLKWAVLATTRENLEIQINGQENYELIKAELMKRLNK